MPPSLPAPDHSGEAWPDQATDFIVNTVEVVRDKTVGPAVTVARGVVFGTFALFVALSFVVIGTIFVVRILTNYMPNHRVWIVQLGFGFVCCFVAYWLYRKARKAGRT